MKPKEIILSKIISEIIFEHLLFRRHLKWAVFDLVRASGRDARAENRVFRKSRSDEKLFMGGCGACFTYLETFS